MSDRSRYSIIPLGSAYTGFALTIGGVIRSSDPDMIRLAGTAPSLVRLNGGSFRDARVSAVLPEGMEAVARRPVLMD